MTQGSISLRGCIPRQRCRERTPTANTQAIGQRYPWESSCAKRVHASHPPLGGVPDRSGTGRGGIASSRSGGGVSFAGSASGSASAPTASRAGSKSISRFILFLCEGSGGGFLKSTGSHVTRSKTLPPTVCSSAAVSPLTIPTVTSRRFPSQPGITRVFLTEQPWKTTEKSLKKDNKSVDNRTI